MEQETFCRTDGTHQEFDVYSRDPVFKRRMEKRGYTMKEDSQGLWSVKIPFKAIWVRSTKPKRTLTPEQRAQLISRGFRRGKDVGKTKPDGKSGLGDPQTPERPESMQKSMESADA